MPPVEPELLDEAVALAHLAGELTLRYFRCTDLRIDRKGDGTPVTEADRGAERLLREELAERHPDDGILGEEEAETPGTSGRRWIIDPIDGTKAFTHGVPLYTNLLALEDARRHRRRRDQRPGARRDGVRRPGPRLLPQRRPGPRQRPHRAGRVLRDHQRLRALDRRSLRSGHARRAPAAHLGRRLRLRRSWPPAGSRPCSTRWPSCTTWRRSR